MCAGSHTAPAENTSNDSSTMSQPQNRRKCPFLIFGMAPSLIRCEKYCASLSLHTRPPFNVRRFCSHTHTRRQLLCVSLHQWPSNDEHFSFSTSSKLFSFFLLFLFNFFLFLISPEAAAMRHPALTLTNDH